MAKLKKSKLEQEFLEFAEMLNKHNVDYILIGGQAVILYGYIRTTKDIDFLIQDSKDNIEKVMNAISDFYGTPVNPDAINEMYEKENGAIFLGRPPKRIDVIKKTEGIDFDEARKKCVELIIDGVPLVVIDIDTLIKNKKLIGRPQDLIDVDKLEKIRAQRKV